MATWAGLDLTASQFLILQPVTHTNGERGVRLNSHQPLSLALCDDIIISVITRSVVTDMNDGHWLKRLREMDIV
ncbi:hypothetical protein AAFF_G00111010 [Aldrovandia affinis]|uniref:Uncharacterized protein n=1 Tax=Aldrovandia affinis TaxID=143900 RepID=A0AAD7WAM3_9TELE|nr:hypothetical protein AAFF_G00111010 [Aldrovandia affinis]